METKRSKKWVYIVLAILLLALLLGGIYLLIKIINENASAGPSAQTTLPHEHVLEYQAKELHNKNCAHMDAWKQCVCGYMEDAEVVGHKCIAQAPVAVYQDEVAVQYISMHECDTCNYFHEYVLTSDDIINAGLAPISCLNGTHNLGITEAEIHQEEYNTYCDENNLQKEPIAEGFIARYFKTTKACADCEFIEVTYEVRTEPQVSVEKPDEPTAPGHVCQPKVVEKVDATCTATGFLKEKCDCGLVTTKTLPIKKHTYGEWTVSVPATCTKAGEKVRYCTACKDADTMGIAKVPHELGDAVVKPMEGLCKGSGVSTKTCKHCDYTEEQKIYNGCVFGEWTYKESTFEYTYEGTDVVGNTVMKTKTEPTHTQKTRTCKNCGKSETIDLPQHRCGYGKLYPHYTDTLYDDSCQTQSYRLRECNICGYTYKYMLEWGGKPKYGAHDYKVTENTVLCQNSEYHDKLTMIVRTCAECGQKKWEVEHKPEYILGKARYNIAINLVMSYCADIPMSGEGEPDARWYEAWKYYPKFTNPVYEDGYLVEYTIYWWDKDGKMYETLVNIEQCYQMYIERYPNDIDPNVSIKRYTLMFGVGKLNILSPTGYYFS